MRHSLAGGTRSGTVMDTGPGSSAHTGTDLGASSSVRARARARDESGAHSHTLTHPQAHEHAPASVPCNAPRVSLVQRLSDQSYSSAREIIVKEMKANQEAIAQLEKRIEELVHILKQAGVELPPFPPLNE